MICRQLYKWYLFCSSLDKRNLAEIGKTNGTNDIEIIVTLVLHWQNLIWRIFWWIFYNFVEEYSLKTNFWPILFNEYLLTNFLKNIFWWIFWRIFEDYFLTIFLTNFLTNFLTCNLLIIASFKGQLISKRFFGIADFLQKTNENTSHTSKNELISSFFGGNRWPQKPFWN